MATDSGESSSTEPASRSGTGPPGQARNGPDHSGIEPGAEPGQTHRWRRWRQTRPFWGALLVILGGGEILASERAPLPLIIHIGFQGLAGYLTPVIMILLGVLLLFHPVQRTFYSLLAVLLALSTWITSNLGGFLIGMLLGVVGGSLAFAWAQREQRGKGRHSRPQPRRDTSSAGLALIRGEPASGADQADRPNDPHVSGPDDGRARAARGAAAILAIPLVPIVLSPAAGPAPAGLLAPRGPGPTARPVPAPSAPGATGPGGTGPGGTGPGPVGKRRGHPPVAATFARAAADRSSLTSGSAAFTGLSYDGIAEVRTSSGVLPMLKFSMNSLTLSGGITLTVTEAGHWSTTRDSSLELSGHVELYTTKISGSLAGTRVSYSPDRPPAGLRPDLTLTKVAADQLFAAALSSQAIGSRLSAG